MAGRSLTNHPHKYFKPGIAIDEQRVSAFRDCYRTLSGVEQFDGHEVDETALLNVAAALDIVADSDDSRAVLRTCVQYNDDEQTFLTLDILIQGPVQPLAPEFPEPRRPAEEPRSEHVPTNLAQVECVLIVKVSGEIIDNFLRTFLLRVITYVDIHVPPTLYNNRFLLHPRSLLALFVREQVNSLGAIEQRQRTRLRLVEPLTITDEFGTWSYDHFRDLFEMELHACPGQTFPAYWVLAANASIHCQFVTAGAGQTAENLVLDRPRTNSLRQFVLDVCAKEDNGQAESWLEALHKEDIRSFSHLSNLKQTEWDNIKRLSMHAKKMLKTAVDRERESAADDRRRLFEESAPNQEAPTAAADNTPRKSRSELLANLHLIKLFVYYTLRFEHALRAHSALPKLEATCLDASFAEMRAEGYADDGLFPSMGEFFLPLTISEEELRAERSTISRQALVNELQELTERVQRAEQISAVVASRLIEVDEQIKSLDETIGEVYRAYITDRLRGNTQPQSPDEARDVSRLHRQWQADRQRYDEEVLQQKKMKERLTAQRAEYEREIDALNTRIGNIRNEQRQPPKPVDKGLVKPARGFIMYGPPGTGKSEIMSKLSMKVGICMVGPPLAAGELNRSLVGESERVIIALASRCHRVPYAMCCLSIDEIDSLAPKRDEDSSEGKVDKISVLLSLIDGIKDVPNLMIFCATNRLHMMDEAFLRRMSGKFFVGRPSSQARTMILSQIPEWALEPNLLDQLAIATTNFSGAACKAFTRAITVRCMATQRTRPGYHINYHEALKIADRTAQQYQIFLGSETLPRLLMRNLVNRSPTRVIRLTRHVYAGRVIVDLHDGSVRIEVIGDDGRLAVVEHELAVNETSVQSLLERLTVYGKDRNVQLLQVIDLNLLASQGAYDEKKVFETLKERYDECVAYPRSMIIYDLDALVGVSKSESDSSMGRSTSSSVVNQSVYTYVRARFREAVVEQRQEDVASEEQQTVEKWAVAVIREPFLLRQFTADVQFARTKHEDEQDELERRKAEDLIKCVKCKDFFIENENKMGNCVHHDGFIFDNSAPELTIHGLSDVTLQLSRLESDLIIDAARRDELERQKTKFRWICCDATVQAGAATGGCKKGKHRCDEEAREGQQQERSYLTEDQIQRWENECRRNPEYTEKWLRLLENRG